MEESWWNEVKDSLFDLIDCESEDYSPATMKLSRVNFNLSGDHSKFASLGSKTQKRFHQPLRSLIANGEAFDGIDLWSWIHKFRLLKVLDLSSHNVYNLSTATMKPLNHLKYLAVKANIFDFHPESHPHLETLIVNTFHSFMLPASFWEMKKLRYVEIKRAEFDWEGDKKGHFEGSSKLENLTILKNIVSFPIAEADRVDVLLRRCPNLQQLHFSLGSDFDISFNNFTLKNLTQLQDLCLSFKQWHTLTGLQLPSNLNKLVLEGIHIESAIPFIAGLPSLEYLQLQDVCFPQSKEWCLGDITFHKLKLLKLVNLEISWWDASEESFPLLETLVIKKCSDLEEIPLSFADIPTLKQIKLIDCYKESLMDSAERIKKGVEETEGNDRIDLIIKNS